MVVIKSQPSIIRRSSANNLKIEQLRFVGLLRLLIVRREKVFNCPKESSTEMIVSVAQEENPIDSDLESLIEQLLKDDKGEENESFTDKFLKQEKRVMTANPRKSARRPTFRAAYIPSIRILRRDIRRKYLEMFTNVMNSHDEKLHSDFLDDFYSPDCSTATSKACIDPSTNDLNIFMVKGRLPMKYLYALHYFTMPDTVMRISNVKICKRLYETGSRILATVTVEATILYSPKNTDTLFERINSNQWYEKMLIDHGKSLVDRNEFYLLDKPMKMKVEGMVTVVLDEWNRFIAVDICNNFKYNLPIISC